MANEVIPFDQVIDDVSSPEVPIGAGVIPFDQVIDDRPKSDLAAIRNAGVKGAGSILGVVQELFAPQQYSDKQGYHITWPSFFGLGPNVPKSPGPTMQQQFEIGARRLGILDDNQPATELGKYGSDVAENAGAALPFGPLAALVSGIFGGTGQYAGQKVGESIGYPTAGKVVGSIVGNLTPAGVAKLGIVKEIGEQLGPVVSQMPVVNRIFGDAPVKAAVGRALQQTSSDISATEKALQQAVSKKEPLSALEKLKTVPEIANDKGLARALDAVESANPSAPFKAIAEERAGLRSGEVLKGLDPTATAYDTSKALEATIGKSAETIRTAENIAWEALPKDAPVTTVLGGLKDDFKATIDSITYSGADPLQGPGKGLVQMFENATKESDNLGTISLGSLQKLRQRALAVSRQTAKATDPVSQQSNQVANALQEHIINIVDNNVSAGLLPKSAADIWENARTITREKVSTFAAPKAGTQNAGTKGLEQVGLKGQALDNTALLSEGLSSPDKMLSHIQAAAAGGEDVRPLYKQALQATLEQKPQTQWADTIAAKRNLWEMVFSKEEMAAIDRNLADIESQVQLGRNATTSFGNSATNPRGNVQDLINRQKGIGNLVTASRGVPALAGGLAGANEGWKSGETKTGKVARALFGGALGAAAGKGLNTAAIKAADKFDNVLIEALRDPKAALDVLEAAKPSNFTKALKAAIEDSVKASVVKNTSSFVNRKAQEMFPNLPSPDGENNENEGFNNMSEEDPLAAIKADPYAHAVALTESGMNPLAKNPESSASGLFQFVKGTANLVGLDDPFDVPKSLAAFNRLTESNAKVIKSTDPVQLYMAHYLGATVYNKLKNKKPLNDDERAQVEHLLTKALPAFEENYKLVTKA